MAQNHNIRKKLAAIVYGINALASLVLGITYLVKSSFMPYHNAALAQSWPESKSTIQVLILALMRVTGGGWIPNSPKEVLIKKRKPNVNINTAKNPQSS